VAEVGERAMSDVSRSVQKIFHEIVQNAQADVGRDPCIQRCGHSWYECSFWDDLPTYRYEIVLCKTCGASWAYDYCSKKGNIEPGEPRCE
jgi:hypothetical protein